ncbi:MAG: hypothetical protein ABF899_03400 [Oenococcus sp.]|uniref:hypothetical protein n=1 Tax=Oenococcus sp. TaxID=1979414 RepID=UPI0039EB029D
MKSFWKIFWWIIGIYVLFNIAASLIGAAMAFVIPAAIIYVIYRQIVKNNRAAKKRALKRERKETGILIYRYDWWKLFPAAAALLPIGFFTARNIGGWPIYTLELTLFIIAGYFVITAFKRWTSLEITDFCLARVDHRYFFRHKIIYEWPRIYYTEVQTEGLNYQLYVATLDGSFTIKQNEVKNIAIPELKKIVDSYIKSGGQEPIDQKQADNQANDETRPDDRLDKLTNYVFDNGSTALDKAKAKIDAYFDRSHSAKHSTSSSDLSPVAIFKRQAQGRQPFASFTAYGLEPASPRKSGQDDLLLSLISWQNISDIKVDDLKAPSRLELKLQLAGQKAIRLIIGDENSSEMYTSSLSVGKLYTHIQSLKAHSRHISMTV